ncbi:protein SAMBA [Malania oleifera]|uniref:protein SAMBA n=1 Tax=Malania oleifera TaxID=397392 RepID=UPI0025ADF8B8|nr:protein SAMBA [Malania oleifera]
MNTSSSATSSSASTITIAGIGGGSSSSALSMDDFHFSSDLISIQDCKEEALLVLKSDLMAALNKEVKSLDEDNWKYEEPRSRIHLISRDGGFLRKQTRISKHANFTLPK